MDWAYAMAKPALFSMDPERAHRFTVERMAALGRTGWGRGLLSALYAPKVGPELAVEAFGLKFAHPLGLAAGVDKDGEAIEAWAALGFGAIEMGTVTPGEGQPGNDKPRVERIPPARAVVNRMGFPNGGAPALAARLAARKTRIPVGANIGKAKTTPNEQALDDYRATLGAVFDHADYIAVNVSSPNTPGLRDLQSVQALEPLLAGTLAENRRLAAAKNTSPRPLLVKIAPDLADEDVDAVAELALGLELDGVIATNTTQRLDLVQPPSKLGAGGLSGAPLAPRAHALTRRLYQRLQGRVPIVGVGGILSADDAWSRIRAGAALLQVYTGLIYEGPSLIGAVTRGLSAKLAAGGHRSVGEVVGSDAS